MTPRNKLQIFRNNRVHVEINRVIVVERRTKIPTVKLRATLPNIGQCERQFSNEYYAPQEQVGVINLDRSDVRRDELHTGFVISV